MQQFLRQEVQVASAAATVPILAVGSRVGHPKPLLVVCAGVWVLVLLMMIVVTTCVARCLDYKCRHINGAGAAGSDNIVGYASAQRAKLLCIGKQSILDSSVGFYLH